MPGSPCRARPIWRCTATAAYVVTGGLAGFGFAAARWLAERGAGHLALIGRRGAETPGIGGAHRRARSARRDGRRSCRRCRRPRGVGGALDAMRARDLPIRGIVHAAAAIVDGMADALSPSDISTALRAKLGGRAELLDRLTRDDPLDLFWLFSSATTVIGAPGQGAYVAANAALEALARRRHGEGRPALAIAWGPIADAGALAGRPDERAALSRRLGARAMPAARTLAALPAMAASGLPVVALADIAWGEVRRTLPILAEPSSTNCAARPPISRRTRRCSIGWRARSPRSGASFSPRSSPTRRRASCGCLKAVSTCTARSRSSVWTR